MGIGETSESRSAQTTTGAYKDVSDRGVRKRDELSRSMASLYLWEAGLRISEPSKTRRARKT